MSSPEERIILHNESMDLTKHSKISRSSRLNDFLGFKKEMARDSTVIKDSLISVSPAALSSENNKNTSQPGDLNQQILELKKEQEMEKQMLWHTFQEKTKQLELQHKLELEHKYQFVAHSHGVFQELREQHIANEEQQQRERRERENNKRKDNCSANASPEVKQILMSFLMNKKAATANGLNTSSPYRNRGVVKSSSGESIPAGSVASSHPYKIPQPPPTITKYDSDFPLRKTASEPNLLKIRLKQSVIERKARMGPLAIRRQERLLQRRQHKQNSVLANCAGSTPESGPNSPPTSSLGGSRGSPTNAPIQEENEDPQYQSGARSSINDLSLFSSPSMPNISLGRPHLHNAQNSAAANLAMITALHQQAAAVAAAAAGQQPLMAGNLPSYYGLPNADGPPPLSSSSSGASIQSQQHSPSADLPPPQAHVSHLTMTGFMHHPQQISSIYNSAHQYPITDTQVAHARLNKQGHRPLGRTQSAPLPLGHPLLTGTGTVNIVQTHYENSDAERQAYEQHHVLQRIRQTVLTRREPELKEEPGEVIDLTDKKKAPKTIMANSVITSTLNKGTLHSSDYESSRLANSGTILNPIPPKFNRDQEYLQQQRELLFMRSLKDDELAHMIHPLSRTLSSPLVHLGPHGISSKHQMSIMDNGQQSLIQSDVSAATSGSLDHIPTHAVNLTISNRRRSKLDESPHKITTGLAYDNLMLKHSCICGNNASHPEHSGRLQSVWARLIETGLASRCARLRSRKATQEELQAVHTEAHAMLFASNQLNRQKIEPAVSFVRLSCGGVGVDLDTTWNEHHTAAAARMAAGCVIDLAFKTSKGDIKNGFAVVRPPGHHAEPNLAMGFCFFNSVAIAARLLKQRIPEMQRILIVDWDVHHGNGTQQVFYEDPDILYLSIHRHDDGNFFPGTGGPTECGAGPGIGFNVNISWSGGLTPPLGDAEYLAAFRAIVMPIAREFNPNIILVSAGFDAGQGHSAPLGGYLVSPSCFGYMTRELMQLANGKVVLALEGGYDLPAICDSAQECVRALLEDEITPILDSELSRAPCQNAINTLQKTIAIQISHWPCVRRLAHTVGMSAIKALKAEREESETVTAMAGLSMQPPTSLPCKSTEEPMDQDDMK